MHRRTGSPGVQGSGAAEAPTDPDGEGAGPQGEAGACAGKVEGVEGAGSTSSAEGGAGLPHVEPAGLLDLPDTLLVTVWPPERVFDGFGVCSKDLSRALLGAPSVRLKGGEARGQGVGGLAGLLGKMTGLRELDLDRNRIGAAGVACLAGALSSLTGLEVLRLVGSGELALEGAEALAGALTHLTSLQTLDLSHCGLGSVGAKALAPHLPSALVSLHLGNNSVADEGMEALAPHLPSGLLYLKLDTNYLQAKGVEALARHLPPTLQVLHLSNNWVGEGAEALAPALTSSLRVLWLSCCHLKSAGVEALVQHMPPCIEELDMYGNSLDRADKVALAQRAGRAVIL